MSRPYPDKLTFQSRTLTTQTGGQVTEGFADVFTRYGKVEQTGANEATKNEQLQGTESYRIRLPRDTAAAAIDSTWRVIWRDQFNVSRTINLTGVDAGQAGRIPEIFLSGIIPR